MLTRSQNKAALVAAHRSGDWESARKLSQEREKLRHRAGHCEVCGAVINRVSRWCMVHYRAQRYPRLLAASVALLLTLTGCHWPGLPMNSRPFGAVYEPQAAEYSMVRTLAVLPVRCPTNGLYRLEYSSDLLFWVPVARNCYGTGTNTITITSGGMVGFCRLVKQKGFE